MFGVIFHWGGRKKKLKIKIYLHNSTPSRAEYLEMPKNLALSIWEPPSNNNKTTSMLPFIAAKCNAVAPPRQSKQHDGWNPPDSQSLSNSKFIQWFKSFHRSQVIQDFIHEKCWPSDTLQVHGDTKLCLKYLQDDMICAACTTKQWL